MTSAQKDGAEGCESANAKGARIRTERRKRASCRGPLQVFSRESRGPAAAFAFFFYGVSSKS